MACFNNRFFSHEGIINLGEDNNNENIEMSIKSLDVKFERRFQRAFDNGQEPTICLFALASIPLLIYLGHKFNDKHKIKIFTAHRNLKWVYNSSPSSLDFTINKPTINVQHQVVLTLNVTAKYDVERVKKAIGGNVDIWEINASDIGVDKISSEEDVNKFYTACVSAMDEIGFYYGKEKEINVFSAICNSLAITFGRAIFAKCHNKINIYDAIKEDSKVVDVLRLSL